MSLVYLMESYNDTHANIDDKESQRGSLKHGKPMRPTDPLILHRGAWAPTKSQTIKRTSIKLKQKLLLGKNSTNLRPPQKARFLKQNLFQKVPIYLLTNRNHFTSVVLQIYILPIIIQCLLLSLLLVLSNFFLAL